MSAGEKCPSRRPYPARETPADRLRQTDSCREPPDRAARGDAAGWLRGRAPAQVPPGDGGTGGPGGLYNRLALRGPVPVTLGRFRPMVIATPASHAVCEPDACLNLANAALEGLAFAVLLLVAPARKAFHAHSLERHDRRSPRLSRPDLGQHLVASCLPSVRRRVDGDPGQAAMHAVSHNLRDLLRGWPGLARSPQRCFPPGLKRTSWRDGASVSSYCEGRASQVASHQRSPRGGAEGVTGQRERGRPARPA